MLRQDILGGNTWPWWAQGLRGVVLVIAGFMALMQPGSAMVGLALAIGIGLLASGVLECISAVRLHRTAAPWGVMLALGIFEVIVGLLVLYRPLLSAAAIPLVVGLWSMMGGIALFVSGLAVNRVPVVSGGTAMATGAILVLLGWMIIAMPTIGALTVVTLVGAALTLAGVMSLAGAYRMYQLRHRPLPAQERERVTEEEREPPRRVA